MTRLINTMVCVIALMLLSNVALASDDGLVAWWKFEKLIEEKIVRPFEEEGSEELEEELQDLRQGMKELQERIV